MFFKNCIIFQIKQFLIIYIFNNVENLTAFDLTFNFLIKSFCMQCEIKNSLEISNLFIVA